MGFLKKEKIRLLFAILLLLVMPIAYAGSQTVGSVVINPSSINLNPASTKTVTCSATISDTDNWNNITTVNATMWDSITSTEGASDDDNEHYTVVSCDLGVNDTETSRPATCGFSLHYHANPSTWTCKIRSYNGTVDLASNSDNANINSLIALDVLETEVNFGILPLGNMSLDDVSTTVRNEGNVKIDAKLSGTAFTCSSGVISPEAVRYSSSSGQSYSSMTELTANEITLDLNVAKSIGDASTKNVYWKIKVPESGVGGSCSDTITFSAAEG